MTCGWSTSTPAGSRRRELLWSSPSTPSEVIEPATNLGVNAVTYDYHLYATQRSPGGPSGAASLTTWGNQMSQPMPRAGRSPMLDTYSGKARTHKDRGNLSSTVHWSGRGDKLDGPRPVPSKRRRLRFDIAGRRGVRLTTNTTTAQMIVAGTDLLGLNFTHTQRSTGSPRTRGSPTYSFCGRSPARRPPMPLANSSIKT